MYDNASVGSARCVRKDARPRFQLGHEFPVLRLRMGGRCMARGPWVMLPATRTDPAPEWNVRVRK